jgi:PAS domain S-box-containing protein
VSATPRFGLSHWLTLLVVGTTVPLLLFGAAALYKMSRDARAVRDQGQADTVRALALAVDGEVRAWKAAVTALAESASLRPDRLAEFYAEAQKVAAPHDGWVVLTVASGEQLLNTLRPLGAPLAKTSSPETIEAVFQSGKPFVSDIVFGQNAQRYLVAVAVPVVRDGRVIHCLTLNFTPQRLTQVLQGQQLPSTWTAAINDRRGYVVARSQHIEARIGKPTVPWLIAAMREADRGFVTGPLTDGRLGRVAFQRMQEVPWDVTLTMPVAELPSDRPLGWFTLLGALLGLVAVAAAVVAGRRLTRSFSRLAAGAAALIKGEAPEPGDPFPIRELDTLRGALVEASATAQALQRERERTVVAEERAKIASASAQALRASEERFRTLFESATDAIFVTDPTGDGQVLAANPAACRMFGYSEGEFVGLTRGAIIDPADPQLAGLLQAREQGGQAVAELTYIRKDGSRFPGELTSAYLGPLGEGRLAVAIVRDITARKRAEAALRESQARLEAVFAAIPDAVVEYDTDGRPARVNAAALRALGLDSMDFTRDEAVARLRLRQLDGRPVRTEELPTSRALLGATVSGELYAVRAADGSERIIASYAAPILQDGAVRGVVALWHDVTELKRAEEGLRQERAALEQRVAARTAELSQTVQQFRRLASEFTLVEQRERVRLAGVLHDGLQQLLVAAKLRVNRLERFEDPTVRQGSQEVSLLLSQALADARALTAELSPPILRSGGLLAGLEWLARWSQEQYHLTVRLAAPAVPLPPLAEDLTVLLFQAVWELLFNAVKYAQVQTATVTLAWDSRGLTIVVADAGVGFDPAALRGPGGDGGGFGLSGIRHRLELLGGCMSVSSTPGQGTQVTLAVLLDPPAAAPPLNPSRVDAP